MPYIVDNRLYNNLIRNECFNRALFFLNEKRGNSSFVHNTHTYSSSYHNHNREDTSIHIYLPSSKSPSPSINYSRDDGHYSQSISLICLLILSHSFFSFFTPSGQGHQSSFHDHTFSQHARSINHNSHIYRFTVSPIVVSSPLPCPLHLDPSTCTPPSPHWPIGHFVYHWSKAIVGWR